MTSATTGSRRLQSAVDVSASVLAASESEATDVATRAQDLDTAALTELVQSADGLENAEVSGDSIEVLNSPLDDEEEQTPAPVDDDDDDSNLSGGAIAGIVVGVVIASGALAALIWKNRAPTTTPPKLADSRIGQLHEPSPRGSNHAEIAFETAPVASRGIAFVPGMAADLTYNDPQPVGAPVYVPDFQAGLYSTSSPPLYSIFPGSVGGSRGPQFPAFGGAYAQMPGSMPGGMQPPLQGYSMPPIPGAFPGAYGAMEPTMTNAGPGAPTLIPCPVVRVRYPLSGT
mmetsp:Transcript_59082/g.139091  ORF Transcript_59082/g.139091 Transcript_59082/m.139091 type:complete len:286 (+) Transcript_59082:2-859(+)